MSKIATITFGDFNPPTIKTKILIDKVVLTAGNNDYYIFVSRNNNPLDYSEKMGFFRIMFPYVASRVIQDENVRGILDVFSFLKERGYTDIQYVCDSNKVAGLTQKLNDWNTAEKNNGGTPFNSIRVVDGGVNSDVDSKNAVQCVFNNDMNCFKTLIPDQKVATDLFNAIKISKDKEPIQGNAAYPVPERPVKKSTKESLTSIIKNILREEEFAEKDRPKIIALRKKSAADKVKERGEIEKSVKSQLKDKENAFKMALKDPSEDADEKLTQSKEELAKAKQAAINAKKMTTASKSELSAIKENKLV